MTLSGSGPQLLLYSFLGENATEYVWWLLGLTAVIACGVGAVALYKAWRQKRVADAAHPSPATDVSRPVS